MKSNIPVFNNIKELLKWVGLSEIGLVSEDVFVLEADQAISNARLNIPGQYKFNFFTFFLVTDGSVTYVFNKKVFTLESNGVFLTSPAHVRNYNFENLNKGVFITVSEQFLETHCSTDIYSEFPFLLSEAFLYVKCSDENFKDIHLIQAEIKKEMDMSTLVSHQIMGNLMELLLLKVKEIFNDQFNPILEGYEHSNIVDSFSHDLDLYFEELRTGKKIIKLNSLDFSILQGLNESYFSRLIKAKTGRSPNFWINRRLLFECKLLLTETSLPIRKIAEIFQFPSSKHFNYYFKKQTHVPPSLYRKSLT